MSPKTEMELDAILAEFHSGEVSGPENAPAPGERRRAAAREEQAAPPARRESPRRENVRPREQEQPAPAAQPRAREERPASAEDRKAPVRTRRAALGRALMCLVLALLAAALWGLLRWNLRTEQENRPPEPEPLRLELGEALEDYLGRAATSSQG